MSAAQQELTIDWDAFVEQSWQKEAVVLHPGPLASPDEVFQTLVFSSDLYRSGAPKAPFLKLYVNGKQVLDQVHQYLPRSTDGSGAGYEARLRRELNAESFILFMTGFEAFNPQIYDRAKTFLSGLFRRVGIPAGHVELELFLGRYTYTPGGIHNEACTNFQWVIDGDKTMHIWPETQWKKSDLEVHVQHDPTSQEEENFLEHLNVTDFRDSSLALRGGTGDVLYWPSRFWHVGETPELSMAITIAMYMDGRPTNSVSKLVEMLLERRPQARTIGAYPMPLDGKGGEVALDQSLADAVGDLRRLLQDPAFEEALMVQWFSRLTSMSFSKVPERQPIESLALDERVSSRADAPIVWSTVGSRLVVAANGYTSICAATPAAYMLLQRLNSGESVMVHELLGDPTNADHLRMLLNDLNSMRALKRGI